MYQDKKEQCVLIGLYSIKVQNDFVRWSNHTEISALQKQMKLPQVDLSKQRTLVFWNDRNSICQSIHWTLLCLTLTADSNLIRSSFHQILQKRMRPNDQRFVTKYWRVSYVGQNNQSLCYSIYVYQGRQNRDVWGGFGRPTFWRQALFL